MKATPTIERMHSKETYVIWQDADDNVGEPAIAVENYQNGSHVALTQGNKCIVINYETIDALCKLLRKLKTTQP